MLVAFWYTPTCSSRGFRGRRWFMEPTLPFETLEEHFRVLQKEQLSLLRIS